MPHMAKRRPRALQRFSEADVLLNTVEAARELGVSTRTVSNLIAEGELQPAGLVGRSYVFRLAHVREVRRKLYGT